MIFRTSSIVAGEREVSGVPSNFTSDSKASSVSADELFELLKLVRIVSIFPTKNSPNLLDKAYSF